MVKKIAFACCLSLLFTAACSSEIKRQKETEYLRTQPGKPLVYPEGLDRPVQEKTFVIPELSKAEQPASQPPELLALPPRLPGVDVSEDEEDEEQSGNAESEGKSLDEGFLGTPLP